MINILIRIRKVLKTNCYAKNVGKNCLCPQYGEKEDIATIAVKEQDLLHLPKGMNAKINEQIKAQFENPTEAAKVYADKPDDLSGFLV